MAVRTIIFRGKRIDNGEWVEGFVFDDGLVGSERLFIGSLVITEATGTTDDVLLINGYALCEVIPETVSQYTGLKDKNGKRIFEGDIVSTDIARPYLIVEFRDGCFMFNCNDGGKDYYDIMLPILEEAQTEYKYGEVIGNIHDNGELLEVR